MATLALPAPANAVFAETYFKPSLVQAEAQSTTATTCLLLSSRSQPRTAKKLAGYQVNLAMHEGSLVLKGYMLSELVGPRPYVYLKFTNGSGIDISDEVFLACTAELRFSAGLFLQALALANLSASTYPAETSVLPVPGLNAVFSFRNYPTGAHTFEDVFSVALLPRTLLALPTEEDSNRINDPTLSLALMNGNRQVGGAVTIGRCVQI
jgi:hypothetical protein